MTPRKPNVILVITDDQGYGDISCHGNPILQTPNLDGLAAQSVRLDDHHHDPLCSPSRAALLTGQYAARNGVWHVIQGRHLLHPQAATMADVFKANGYRTGMFGKWHLGDNYPFAPQYRGFDEVLCHRGGGVGELPDCWGNNYYDDVYYRNGAPEQCCGYCTDVFFDAALDFIEASAEEPFFVYLATNAMHAPFIVPQAYAAPYLAQGLPERRANFYGMIANFDENMGRLLSRLTALGIADDAIVIFTSDHGTAAGYDEASGEGFDAGMRGVKGSVYEGGHRVSFFLRWTGHLPAGRKLSALTAHIDALPTLVDLCDLDCDIDFDGVSLAALMRGDCDDLPKRSHFIQLQPDIPRKWHQTVALKGEWRLVEGIELYNVADDPSQRRNIAADYPRVVANLRRDYDDWWRNLAEAHAATVAIPVGTRYENPVELTARDWHPTAGRVPWLQAWIDDSAFDSNGFWLIEVASVGDYIIELRSYPREADLPLGADIARLRIDDRYLEATLAPGDKAAAFCLRLERGQVTLQSWLIGNGRERGAYYVYVEKRA